MGHFAPKFSREFAELVDLFEPRETLFLAEVFDGLFEEVFVVVEAGVCRDVAAVVLRMCLAMGMVTRRMECSYFACEDATCKSREYGRANAVFRIERTGRFH